MDKTFSNTFRKAFTVAAFVSLAVMAAVTGAAMFQLYVTGQRYARLRNYATEQGIKLAGSSDKPLFSIKSGSAPELADCLEERLVGTYWLSDCALEIQGDTCVFTGKLTGGFSLAKTAFPFAGSDDSDNYGSCSGYYDDCYYSDNSYNHCRQGDASGCPQNGKLRRLRPARPASLPEGDGEAGEGCVNARLKVNSPCVTIR